MTVKSLPTVSFDEMKVLATHLGVPVVRNDNAAWLASRIVSAHPTYKALVTRKRSDAYVMGIVEIIADEHREEAKRLDAVNVDPFERGRERVERFDAAPTPSDESNPFARAAARIGSR